MLRNLLIGLMIRKFLILMIKNQLAGMIFLPRFLILKLKNLMIGMKMKMENGLHL